MDGVEGCGEGGIGDGVVVRGGEGDFVASICFSSSLILVDFSGGVKNVPVNIGNIKMKMCGYLGGKRHNIEDHCHNCSYNTFRHVSVCVVTNFGLT